jgi:hypothetical protein
MAAVLAPPPDEKPRPAASAAPAPVTLGPSIPPTPTASANQPLADLITELEADDRPAPSRTPPSKFRQSHTQSGSSGGPAARGSTLGGRGTLGNAQRRPQAVAPAATPPPPAPRMSRGAREITEVGDAETETHVDSDWRGEIPVDDSQLVDWKTDASGSAITGDDDFSDLGRKR